MKSVVLVGKVWEIRQLLKQRGKQFTYVSEWISFIEGNKKQANFKKNCKN